MCNDSHTHDVDDTARTRMTARSIRLMVAVISLITTVVTVGAMTGPSLGKSYLEAALTVVAVVLGIINVIEEINYGPNISDLKVIGCTFLAVIIFLIPVFIGVTGYETIVVYGHWWLGSDIPDTILGGAYVHSAGAHDSQRG